ncbi:hypothetical protein [Cytobacillus purgationiresistens]|uniref:Membrane protein n=1 Tax=Cytobacillus purgationiresistens TaxID=863449 RepID=A0ABU0ALJ9_9BACI|nr:hypothetical protein [Cytobacillus purgationiresistens]MDQ0271642.1 putative membrane protein [Cytobacillus purgationiresistens]
MFLVIAIILCMLAGLGLLMFDPYIAGLFAFAVIAGCLFKIMDLLSDIHKALVQEKPGRIKQVYEDYLKEKDDRSVK